MSDSPKDEGAGTPEAGSTDADGSLEVKPQWGDAEGDNKPRPMAVRKEGDVAEAMQASAADKQYTEALEVESVGVQRERRIGMVLVVLIVAGVLGLAVWEAVRVKIEMSVRSETNYLTRIAQVTAKLKTSHDIQVRVKGRDKDAKAMAPGDDKLIFDIPLKDLKLGINDLSVEVLRSGEVLKSLDVQAYKDFELAVDKDKAFNPPHPFYLNFKVAEGWKVQVAFSKSNVQDHEPDKAGIARVTFPLDKIFAVLERFKTPTYKFLVPTKLLRPDGEVVPYVYKGDILLPQARLVLDIAGEAVVVGGRKVTVSGSTTPGAVVKVGATDAKVSEEGRFTASVSLPKAKKVGFKGIKDLAGAMTVIRSSVEEGAGVRIPVVTKVKGKVESSREILVVQGSSKNVKRFKKLSKKK